MNGLFPLSLVVAVAVTVWVFLLSLDPRPIPEQIGLTLVATLLALGVLEHLFLMLPLGEGRLWGWASPAEEPLAQHPADPLHSGLPSQT